MMKLTREQAIAEHRKMWRWIAEETLKRKKKVWKENYFKEHPEYKEHPMNGCWCCEYVHQYDDICSKCPLKWPDNIFCIFINSFYKKWFFEADYEKAAKYAREIAELGEKEI